MSGSPRFQVFFRTSKTFGKNPIPNINSKITYHSLLKSFRPEEIAVICDHASPRQRDYFMRHASCCYLSNLGNCGSFRLQAKLAASKHPADIYYFCEDDHLHLPEQKRYLAAGLEHFDIVSLYDHPDKYSLWNEHGLMRKVVATAAGHFAGTPSTVMTFALKRQTLLQHLDLMIQGPCTDPRLPFPKDHELFTALSQRGLLIGTALPGRSTHCEREGLSPYVDWQHYANSIVINTASPG